MIEERAISQFQWVAAGDFEISLYPVSNRQYAAWLRSLPREEAARHYSPLMEDHFFGGIRCDFSVKDGFEKKPVVFVSWFDAQAFAAAHGARLPTADEWKKAAAWLAAEGRFAKYANGRDEPPDQSEANIYDIKAGWALPAPHLADVDHYPPAGPYALCGMAGNVAEWVDATGGKPFKAGEALPWQPALGGSLFRTAGFTALDAGEADSPDKRLSTFSFRMVKAKDGGAAPAPPAAESPPAPPAAKDGSAAPAPPAAESPPCAIAKPMVFIGDSGNKPYRLRVGCVPYGYEIARVQTTNSDWCDFLNAVGAEKAKELFHPDMEKGILGGIERLADGAFAPKAGWEKKPVVYVNYFSLLRYCNFLTCGDTETGSYDMAKPLPSRMEGGVYFLPTSSEWVKAAYYDSAAGRYRKYPSGDVPPGQDSANYQPGDAFAEGAPFYFADVDAYAAGRSAYGVLQMGGNAWEFLEDVDGGQNRLRGGSFGYTQTGLDIDNCDCSPLGAGNYVFGARIVKIAGGWRNEYLRLPWKYAILQAIGRWKTARTVLRGLRIMRRFARRFVRNI